MVILGQKDISLSGKKIEEKIMFFTAHYYSGPGILIQHPSLSKHNLLEVHGVPSPSF